MIEGVVIDVDDTLCMTEAACFDLENEVLTRLGRAPMARNVHVSTWGQPLLPAMTVRSPGLDLDQFSSIYDRLLPEYVADGRLDAIPEANLWALDTLARQGRQVALLTSRSSAEMTHLSVPGHALTRRISAIYHAERTRYLKPDPRAFLPFLTESGIPPDRCVYIGDSPGDAVAATGAGLHFIASLQSGLRTREDFAAWPVDDFISDFSEVVPAVKRLDTAILP